MTNIFSLVKESSIPDEIFSNKYSKEIYTESYINLLESFNETLSESTMALYTTVAEAENVKQENDAIKNFISQIQSQLGELSLKLSSATSRFAISLSKYCDIAKQLVDDNSSIGIDSNISFTGKYLAYEAPRLLDSNVPRMNPYTIFEKEFNLIAQLMQDLPVTASNKEKLDAIASVCDKFNGFMSESIRRNVYIDLIQQGEEGPNPLSSSITTLFRNKEAKERSITIEEYQDAVSCISNANQYISSISEMNDKLIRDLNHIIEDLGELLTGCDRNKFKVNTMQNGIRNTIYSVDIYCSNKIMWLVQEKVRQICDVYDKYFIALAVKMDCIISYVKQSSDIIEAFNYLNTKCYNNKCRTGVPVNKPNDDLELDKPTTDNGDDNPDFDDSENMDNTGKEVAEGEEPENDTQDLDLGEMDDTSSETEEPNDELEEPVPNFEAASYGEFEDELLEFYIDLHEASVGYRQLEILEQVGYILEDGENQEGTIAIDTASGDDMAKNGAILAKEKKRSLWRRIIDKIAKIWSKLKEAFSKTYQEKVTFLKENESAILEHGPFDYTISMPVIRHDNIDKIKLPDFNTSDFKMTGTSSEDFEIKYKTEEEFVESEANIKQFAPKKDTTESLSQNIKDFVIDPKEKIDNANKIDPAKIYNEYCKTFMDRLTDIEAMTKDIEKSQSAAGQITKDMLNANESSNTYVTADMYFNEFQAGGDSKDGDKKDESNDSKDNDEEEKKIKKKTLDGVEKGLNIYFGVCSKIISSKMYIIQKVFDEYYAYLSWHITKAKDKIEESRKDKKEDSNKDNNSSNDTGANNQDQQDTKFE